MGSELNAFGTKVQDQSVAFEVAVVVGVELDARFSSVNLFGYDTTAGEDIVDLFDGGVGWKIGYVDGCVLALAGFRRWFGFLGRYGSTTRFLSVFHHH